MKGRARGTRTLSGELMVGKGGRAAHRAAARCPASVWRGDPGMVIAPSTPGCVTYEVLPAGGVVLP